MSSTHDELRRLATGAWVSQPVACKVRSALQSQRLLLRNTLPSSRAAIVTKLQQDAARVIAAPDVRNRFIENGGEVVGNTPAEFQTS
jgi:hypothetical protein